MKVTKKICKSMVDKGIWKKEVCDNCMMRIKRESDTRCKQIREGKNDYSK